MRFDRVRQKCRASVVRSPGGFFYNCENGAWRAPQLLCMQDYLRFSITRSTDSTLLLRKNIGSVKKQPAKSADFRMFACLQFRRIVSLPF